MARKGILIIIVLLGLLSGLLSSCSNDLALEGSVETELLSLLVGPVDPPGERSRGGVSDEAAGRFGLRAARPRNSEARKLHRHRPDVSAIDSWQFMR